MRILAVETSTLAGGAALLDGDRLGGGDGLKIKGPHPHAPVAPAPDEKKGEVSASLYHWSGDAMSRDWEYLAVAPEALCDRLRGPVIFVGDAVETLGGRVRARRGGNARVAPRAPRPPLPGGAGGHRHARPPPG